MGIKLQTWIAFLVGVVIVAACEYTFEGGSLLFCMLFFVMVSQGPITIIAATDISQGNWAKPYREIMLSVRHMNLFLAIAFMVFFVLAGKLHLYDAWMPKHQTAWLNPEFFIGRNIVLLLLAWVVSNIYANATLKDKKSKITWALMWVFTYVTCQTIVAVDWVMSLEYPWISTLFGAYFFVEAFYAGLALAAVFTFFKYQDFVDTWSEKTFKKSQMDMMTMMFGFSIFWAYQFFSQYIVIWYGNIPEEVAFLTSRLAIYGDGIYSVLIILFLIPFIALLFRKIKGNPRAVMLVGLVIWCGLLIERIIYLGPHMALNPLITLVEFTVLGVVFFLVIRNRMEIAPAS